jgi:hypothetical protein
MLRNPKQEFMFAVIGSCVFIKRFKLIVQEQFESTARIIGPLLCFMGKEPLTISFKLKFSSGHCDDFSTVVIKKRTSTAKALCCSFPTRSNAPRIVELSVGPSPQICAAR